MYRNVVVVSLTLFRLFHSLSLSLSLSLSFAMSRSLFSTCWCFVWYSLLRYSCECNLPWIGHDICKHERAARSGNMHACPREKRDTGENYRSPDRWNRDTRVSCYEFRRWTESTKILADLYLFHIFASRILIRPRSFMRLRGIWRSRNIQSARDMQRNMKH